MNKFIYILIFLLLGMPAQVSSLPFNDDMVDSQIKIGATMRARPKGTVPLGSLAERVENKEEALKLTNPMKTDANSVLRGKRLYEANCASCHGNIGSKDYEVGVAGALMGAPNIADKFYHDRTDGSVFGTVRFGSAIMPALGWKLSNSETWDIVSYVKDAQAKANK